MSSLENSAAAVVKTTAIVIQMILLFFAYLNVVGNLLLKKQFNCIFRMQNLSGWFPAYPLFVSKRQTRKSEREGSALLE